MLLVFSFWHRSATNIKNTNPVEGSTDTIRSIAGFLLNGFGISGKWNDQLQATEELTKPETKINGSHIMSRQSDTGLALY